MKIKRKLFLIASSFQVLKIKIPLFSRLKEVEAMSELKELRLKIMDLETQNQVSNNQLKRKGDEVKRLAEALEECRKREAEVQTELRESQRRSDSTFSAFFNTLLRVMANYILNKNKLFSIMKKPQ
jgi:chromosome segregation ATPase